MKKFVAVIMAVACVMLMASCKKENTQTNKNDKTKVITEKETEKKDPETTNENSGENNEETLVGSSGFSFDIENEPFIIDIEPVEVAEIDFDEFFIYEDGDFNLSLNVEEADASKLAGLSSEELRALSEKKLSFLKEVVSTLKSKNINVEIDSASGEIIMDASILFGVDESEVSDEGKDFLKKFIPAYMAVVSKEEYNDFIAELTIEGHTDTDGDYDYNKKLSQNRADNVKEYILSNEVNLKANEHSLLDKLAKSYGRSYDEPIKDSNGEIDMDASRRVTIGFLISID